MTKDELTGAQRDLMRARLFNHHRQKAQTFDLATAKLHAEAIWYDYLLTCSDSNLSLQWLSEFDDAPLPFTCKPTDTDQYVRPRQAERHPLVDSPLPLGEFERLRLKKALENIYGPRCVLQGIDEGLNIPEIVTMFLDSLDDQELVNRCILEGVPVLSLETVELAGSHTTGA